MRLVDKRRRRIIPIYLAEMRKSSNELGRFHIQNVRHALQYRTNVRSESRVGSLRSHGFKRETRRKTNLYYLFLKIIDFYAVVIEDYENPDIFVRMKRSEF
ncbi:MAG: hypothetical protein OWS74_05780, partial [Firmicutes bacterium]|nr:hypothetical protein [Bacillota bacterium]